jgi:phage tail tape-measure protein
MFRKFTLAAALATAATVAVPAAADAHRIGRAHSHASYDQGYYGRSSYDDGYSERRCSGTTGTILGAAAGALLGRAVDNRGSRVTGTVVGGAAGALLGREVGKSRCRR